MKKLIISDGTKFLVAGPSPDNMITFTTTTRSGIGITPTQLGVALDTNNTTMPTSALISHWLVN